MTTSPLPPLSPIGAWGSIDHFYMELAIEQARLAEQEGEVPVGAILVLERSIIGAGHNRPIQRHDPTAHAEIEVLRQAAIRLGNYRLPGTTLYVTVEPCAMCAGALVNARVARVVFGTTDLRAGAVETHFQVTSHPSLNHRVESLGGVLGDECRRILQRFFQERRSKRQPPLEGLEIPRE